MEDEFVRQDHTSPETLCDFGSCEYVASIAFVLAKRAFNFKIFEDWAQAYQYFPKCNGIIEAGNKKYTLPAVQYTSAERFQVCETCYRLIFIPHTIIRPQLQEIPGAQNHTREACTMNVLSVTGYLQALLKATWKSNSLILLEFARDQVPMEPCPGSSPTTAQKLWYGVTGADAFVCCQSCFRTLVLPSTLYSSFEMISPLADGQMEYSCDLSNPQIHALFVAACEAETISVFLDGLDNGAAEIEDSPYPEEDLCGICGTPEQIQQVEALVEEIMYLQAESRNLQNLGWQMHLNASIVEGAANISLLASGDYGEGIYDEHGKYFESRTLAEASAMKSTADSRLHEASRLNSLAYEKRFYLLELKSMLTKEP